MQRKWMKSAAVFSDTPAQSVACNTRHLWSTTSPAVIMNLQWNHWAALASVMLGEMTVRGTGRVESSMKSNSNPGTMSRPKCAHILSQLSPPAHPSNPQRTVTPFSSPGIANIPFLLLLPSLRLLCQPLLPSDFSSVSPSLRWTCLVFFFPESWVLWTKKKQTGRVVVTFSSMKETHQEICLGHSDVKIAHMSLWNHRPPVFTSAILNFKGKAFRETFDYIKYKLFLQVSQVLS